MEHVKQDEFKPDVMKQNVVISICEINIQDGDDILNSNEPKREASVVSPCGCTVQKEQNMDLLGIQESR